MKLFGEVLTRTKAWLSMGLALLLAAVTASYGSAAEASVDNVTLLLPGMKFTLDDPSLSFGAPVKNKEGKVYWTGIIGVMDRAGHKFGGIIRPKGADLTLPACLERTGVRGDPSKANLFVLDYSSSANVDGLAYKTLELAECLKVLRRYTGAKKINLVAYSAGGLVARTYLQSALPGLEYRRDVGRLITISTPHLGATKAEHFGDFLGTRATAIRPSSELIQRINNKLDLPGDVHYASVIVRGVKIGSRRLHDQHKNLFEKFVDAKMLSALPLDYKKGSDQVVNVWSQNLALTSAARQYETKHKRPVQFVLARVSDPSPDDWMPFDTTVHAVAPNDRKVIKLVETLAGDSDDYWTGLTAANRSRRVHREASNCAFGIIENAMARKHRYSEVFETKVDRVRLETRKGDLHKFTFEGHARSKWRSPPRIRARAEFAGTMNLNFDQYGRVMHCNYKVAKK